MNAYRFALKKDLVARLRSIGFAAMLCLAPPLHGQPTGIPSMGSASSAELSPSLERTLGDAIMEQGRRDSSYIHDADINQYLTGLGRTLAAHGPGGGQVITVFAVSDPEINAFALPGGYIGVNSGLIVAAPNESALASVIAHEIGHVVQRHIARGMTQQSQNSGVMIASLVGAVLAGLAGSGDLAMGVAAFGQAAALDRQLGFSRQAEQDADRAGFDMLIKAGFNPRGMEQMFGQLMNASRLNEGTGGGTYASTHPLSIQRLSDIENRARAAPRADHHDSNAFWYLRARLRVMQARNTDARRNVLRQLELETQQLTGLPRSAAWYGIAYAAWQRNDPAAAQTALQNANMNGLESPEVAPLVVSLAADGGRRDEALKLAQAAWTRWPDSQAVALSVVQAMQKDGRDPEAIKFATARLKQWPDMASLYRLQAQSHERLGQQVDARRAMAAYYEDVGALPTAVEQLRQARGMTQDFYVQSELDVQIRTLRQRLQSERELLKRFKAG